MTKRDFFIIIIRLFGLYSLILSLFTFIPNSFPIAFYDIDIISMIWIIGATLITLGIFVLLVFKSDKVVQILKLDKGFDDDRIEFSNFNQKNIVMLSSILIGGFLIIDNISDFLSHIIFFFKADLIGTEYNNLSYLQWTISGVNIIIGYLLITNHNSIAKLLRIEKTK
jgi:hypothetical protein